MDLKKTLAVGTVVFLLGATISLADDKKHIDQTPIIPDSALLMDGGIISTHTGTAPTLGDFKFPQGT